MMTKINKVCKQFSFVSILSNAAIFGLTRHIRNFISGLTLFFFSLTRYVQYLIQLIAISNIYKVISCWTNQLTACIYIIIIAYAICINPNFIQYVTYLVVEYSPWILNGLESIFDYINLAKGGGVERTICQKEAFLLKHLVWIYLRVFRFLHFLRK
jgi:hypothetical protein